jgi:hypothetical protein
MGIAFGNLSVSLLLASERQIMRFFSWQGQHCTSFRLPLVIAKKSSPVYYLPRLRKFGK